MKKPIQFLLFLTIAIFVFSCGKKTNATKSTANIEITTNIIIDYIDKGMYVGMLGSDSIFINSKPSDSESGKSDWGIYPIIYIGNKVLYQETDGERIFLINKSDIKIITLKQNVDYYLLLTMTDVVFEDNWLVLKIHNQKVESINSILKQILNDIDNDGYYEIGGREPTDYACMDIEKDCDSLYYVPFEIFRLGKTFEYDSVLSKKLTIGLFGTYLDKYPNDTILQIKRHIDWNKTKWSDKIIEDLSNAK
jgi:hypothetical protein